MPISESIYGSEGLMLASIYLIPTRILIWIFGLAILINKKDSVKETISQILLNPAIIAVFLVTISGLSNIQLTKISRQFN